MLALLIIATECVLHATRQQRCSWLALHDALSPKHAVCSLNGLATSSPEAPHLLQTENPGNACVQAVYHKGQQFVPEAHARQDPASVPDVLLAWVQALSGLDQAQRIHQAVLHLLNSRPGHTQTKSAQVPALASLLHITKYQGWGSESPPDSSGASRLWL